MSYIKKFSLYRQGEKQKNLLTINGYKQLTLRERLGQLQSFVIFGCVGLCIFLVWICQLL